MDKNRVMALTDGIIAIAATIMVLELKVPEQLTMRELISRLPVLLAYVVSFTQIYLAWRSHHNAFMEADVMSISTFLINGIWLFFQTLVPFGTGMIGKYPHSKLAAVIYVLIIFLWILTFQFLDLSIIASNPGAKNDEVMAPVSRVTIFGGYALAFVMAVVKPVFVLPVIAGLSVIMVVRIVWEKLCSG